MAEIHIVREHALGMAAARQAAMRWAQQMESEYRLVCTYEEGQGLDLLIFEGAGAKGTLQVSGAQFELNAKLGFLLGNFKQKIEAVILQKLDSFV